MPTEVRSPASVPACGVVDLRQRHQHHLHLRRQWQHDLGQWPGDHYTNFNKPKTIERRASLISVIHDAERQRYKQISMADETLHLAQVGMAMAEPAIASLRKVSGAGVEASMA
jgi:hypothetical protein